MLWPDLFVSRVGGQGPPDSSRSCRTYLPFAEQGIPIVGLEPSCTLALRDEVPALLSTAEANKVAEYVLTFEELLARDKPELSYVRQVAKLAAWPLSPKSI